MIKEAINNKHIGENTAVSGAIKAKFNEYTYGKKFFISLIHIDNDKSSCHEYLDLVLTTLKDVLKYNVSVIYSDRYSVEFTDDTYVEDLTNSLKTALRGKFKGGRITKTTIRSLCVTFPNNVYFLIDIDNGWETGKIGYKD